MNNHRRGTNEDGAALLIALILMTVFALIAAAFLSQMQVHLDHAITVQNHHQKTYSADAGVRYGIDVLRSRPELCPNASAGTSPVDTVNVNPLANNGSQTTARTVSVTCQTTRGASTGAGGYGIVVTNNVPTANPLTLQGATRKNVSGAVFVNGAVSWGPGMLLDGNFYQKPPAASSCAAVQPTIDRPPSSPTSSAAKLFLDGSQYNYYCNTTAVVPAVEHTPPALPTDSSNPTKQVAGSGANACTIWSPGRYSTLPDFSATPYNYFGSGVYYFDLPASPAPVLNVKQTQIWGGQPASRDLAEQKIVVGSSATYADGVSDGTTTYKSNSAGFSTSVDKGMYVYGEAIIPGTKIVSVTNSTTVVLSQAPTVTGSGQHFTVVRKPPCANSDNYPSQTGIPPALQGTQIPGTSGTGVEFIFNGQSRLNVDTQGQIELFTRTGNASGTANVSFLQLDTAPTNVDILTIKDGNPQKVAIHGLAYAANGNASLTATNDVIAEILGGLVANSVTLQSSASASGLSVSTDIDNGTPRQIVVTATDPGDGNERSVMSKAVVTIQNDLTSTASIASWRTTYLSCNPVADATCTSD